MRVSAVSNLGYSCCFVVFLIVATEHTHSSCPSHAAREPSASASACLAQQAMRHSTLCTVLRLAGGSTTTVADIGELQPTEMSLQVRHGGATAHMLFSAVVAGGQLEEIEASWQGHAGMSAPVESAEDLVFLAATILRCDARRSVLWLQAASTSQNAPHDLLSPASPVSRPLYADSATALWQELRDACAAGMALVLTDADADEIVEKKPEYTLADDSRGDVMASMSGPSVQNRQRQQNQVGRAGQLCDMQQVHQLSDHKTLIARGVNPGVAAGRGKQQQMQRDTHMMGVTGKTSEAEAWSASRLKSEAQISSVSSPPSASSPPSTATHPSRLQRLQLTIKHPESNRREQFVIEHFGGQAVGQTQGPHALKALSEHAPVLTCIWLRGKARFNVTCVAELRLYISRVMLLDAHDHGLFRLCGQAPGEAGGMVQISNECHANLLWQLLLQHAKPLPLSTNGVRHACKQGTVLVLARTRKVVRKVEGMARTLDHPTGNDRQKLGSSLAVGRGATGSRTGVRITLGTSALGTSALGTSLSCSAWSCSGAAREDAAQAVGASTERVFEDGTEREFFGFIECAAPSRAVDDTHLTLDQKQCTLEWTQGRLRVELGHDRGVEEMLKLVAPVLGVPANASGQSLSLSLFRSLALSLSCLCLHAFVHMLGCSRVSVEKVD